MNLFFRLDWFQKQLKEGLPFILGSSFFLKNNFPFVEFVVHSILLCKEARDHPVKNPILEDKEDVNKGQDYLLHSLHHCCLLDVSLQSLQFTSWAQTSEVILDRQPPSDVVTTYQRLSKVTLLLTNSLSETLTFDYRRSPSPPRPPAPAPHEQVGFSRP